MEEDPTEEEILAACVIIREGWSKLDPRLRRGHRDFVGFEGPGIREIDTSTFPDWAKQLIREDIW
jgi:hypothetical protein